MTDKAALEEARAALIAEARQHREWMIGAQSPARMDAQIIDLLGRLVAALEATPATAGGGDLVDGAKEADLRILLQLALDEMRNVIEAVDHQHETRPGYLKYGTPYGAINGLAKVREDILVQCAMWGIEVSPKRPSPETDEAAFNLPDAERLGALIREKMGERSYRDVAPETGLSVATLNRLARGHPPSLADYLKVLAWLGVATKSDTSAECVSLSDESEQTDEAVFEALRAANEARQKMWANGESVSLLFRATELGGECGEVLNVCKKIERERQGWRGSRATVQDLADELADVVICADLLAMTEGIDLDAAIIRKFNATSEKVGLPHRLAGRRPSPSR